MFEKSPIPDHRGKEGSRPAPSRATFFQPKLSVNAPGDAYEQEADAMADKVMRMQIPASQGTFFNPSISSIQRKCAACEEEGHTHRKESAGSEVQGNNELDSYVGSLASSGQLLPESSRKFFEPRFGQDFSNVRIHTDSVAAKSAQSINALAYTTGNNIVFNQGQYAPGSESGQRLLAHELTHVVQQNSSQSTVQRVHPAIIVSAAVLAAVACSYPFYLYALNNYSKKGDKWMHCWVSCKISFYCGGPGVGTIVGILIGAGKEVVDAALDQLGYPANAEWLDFVADLKGIACLFSTCVNCCDEQFASVSSLQGDNEELAG